MSLKKTITILQTAFSTWNPLSDYAPVRTGKYWAPDSWDLEVVHSEGNLLIITTIQSVAERPSYSNVAYEVPSDQVSPSLGNDTSSRKPSPDYSHLELNMNLSGLSEATPNMEPMDHVLGESINSLPPRVLFNPI